MKKIIMTTLFLTSLYTVVSSMPSHKMKAAQNRAAMKKARGLNNQQPKKRPQRRKAPSTQKAASPGIIFSDNKPIDKVDSLDLTLTTGQNSVNRPINDIHTDRYTSSERRVVRIYNRITGFASRHKFSLISSVLLASFASGVYVGRRRK